MLVFETVLALLLGATILSVIAKRLNVPYPTLLAVGGALVALVPGVPRLDLPPELILALFVAPVLLDAAYDTSLRDLKDTWQPVSSLVLVAVAVTAAGVAFAARELFRDMPWAAAIALGALVAPPDAVAALAVLRQADPPHRIRKVLEGESLLNDASALLLYKLAVASVAAGSFRVADAIPTFVLVALGSIVVGWLSARLTSLLMQHIEDPPTSVIFQFVITFGVWLAAERLGLSAIVTVVVFGLTVARRTTLPARLRLASFAVWESITFVLNVLAFTLIGLQLRPVLEALGEAERRQALGAAAAILGIVIAIRLFWAMTHHVLVRWKHRVFGFRPTATLESPPTAKAAVVVGWSGMRGIVTVAAAMALPQDFPERSPILLTAFVVVLGTLVIQGLTLRPLLDLLRLPKDHTVDAEVSLARKAALQAAIGGLEGTDGSPARRLRLQYEAALSQAELGQDPHRTPDDALRRRMLAKSRRAIDDLRSRHTIGDDAYRLVEEELDWLELSVSIRDGR
jgi:Na+/H+ antiporter